MPGERTTGLRGETTESAALAIQREIEDLVRALQAANARLTKLQAGWLNPPEPNRPAIRDALNSLKSQAQITITTADDILRRMA
jgi:hypothetical protein